MSEIFSCLIRTASLKDNTQTHLAAASPAQCVLLAELFKLPGIGELQGKFILQHERDGIIKADLHLQSQITQVCVVTLEPFAAKIDEHATLLFIPARRLKEGKDEVEIDAETLESPDEIPYTGETIDLGAALTEQLALCLDPYPRKPGAILPAEASDGPASPFASLRRDKDW